MNAIEQAKPVLVDRKSGGGHEVYREYTSQSAAGRVVAKVGFHKIGPQRPYWSVTATIYERSPWGWRATGGGCCHDTIRKKLPELAPAIAWHLCDDRGVPMHYVANATYWLELAAGVSRWGPGDYLPKPPADILRHCILADELGDAEELDRFLIPASLGAMLEPRALDPKVKLDFREWLQARLPSLAGAFEAMRGSYDIPRIEHAAAPTD